MYQPLKNFHHLEQELQIRRYHAIAKARMGCATADIIKESKKAFSDNPLSKTPVKRSSSLWKTWGKWLTAGAEADGPIKITKLALMFDYGVATIHCVLHEDLNVVKKSARLVPSSWTASKRRRGFSALRPSKNLWTRTQLLWNRLLP